jgi:NAD(P)-dependent dehydrogenase (short-subunit alcohol dehydrogenase family)
MRRTVVITGGSGDMAKTIGEELVYLDYDVLLPTRDELNVANVDQVKSYMIRHLPNVLINCAGYINPLTLKDYTTTDDFVEHFIVNTFGPFCCAMYSVQNGCDTIVNIGSTSAFEGRESWGAYCASKAALMSLTETWAREGIKCFSINPGRTNTKMRKKLFKKEDTSTLMSPYVVAFWVCRVLTSNDILSGSHVVVKRDRVYILPMRECPK